MKSLITPLFAVVLIGLIGFAVIRNAGPDVRVEGEHANATTTVVSELESVSDFDRIVAEADVPVLFDFYATWCGPCKTQGKILTQMGIDESEAIVVKINVQDHPGLAERFQVQSIPTLVVFEDGEVTYQQKGLHSKKDLQRILNLK